MIAYGVFVEPTFRLWREEVGAPCRFCVAHEPAIRERPRDPCNVLFGVIFLDGRTFLTPRMPKCNNFKNRSADAVVEKISYAWKVKPTNHLRTGIFHLGANTRFFSEQCQGSLNIHAHSAGSSESVNGPPLCRSFNLSLGARLDSDAERQVQPKRRSRAKSASAGIPSSRSASSRAARSSASSWGGSFTTASSPRARTVTAVPSGRERPSMTTLPSITVPDATCIWR